MPTFILHTRRAYTRGIPVQIIQSNDLDELVRHCQAKMEEDEMILSIEILQDDKVVWDSTAEAGGRDRLNREIAAIDQLAQGPKVCIYCGANDHNNEQCRDPRKSQIMVAAYGGMGIKLKDVSDIIHAVGKVSVEAEQLPTERFSEMDYLGMPMIDPNTLDFTKRTPTGRISKPDPQFQEFKWPNKTANNTSVPGTIKWPTKLDGTFEKVVMSQEEFYEQYYCQPKPEPKEEIRRSVRPKARYKMAMPAIVPASTLRDIPEHKGKFVAIGYMLDRDGNKHTSETRTSLLVKVDIEAGYIETLNSIYEIV